MRIDEWVGEGETESECAAQPMSIDEKQKENQSESALFDAPMLFKTW